MSPQHKERPSPMRIFSLLILLLALAPLPAPAQTPLYKVELIVFEPTDAGPAGEEIWPQDLPAPDMSAAVELEAGAGAGGLRALPESARELTETARLLENSGRYHVIVHRIWQQPGLEADQAVAVAVHGGEDYSAAFPELMAPRWEYDAQGVLVERPGPARLEQLDGWVKIVLGRYLHIYTDLVLRKPVPVEPGESAGASLGQQRRLMEVHMRQQRRMRSRELHYLDHPLLGVLVKVTPLE